MSTSYMSTKDDIQPSPASTPANTKLVFSACDRNKEFILNVLKEQLSDDGGFALEVSSGTGQHVVYFAEQLSLKWTWQPSDCEEKYISSISAYVEESKLTNIKKPIWVDISEVPSVWASKEMNEIDLICNINMIHITPIKCTEGLFKAAEILLKSTGKLVTYGPYAVDGVLSPQSNVDFDAGLKARNPEWGVRDTVYLKSLAESHSLVLTEMVDMPSNNKCLVFVKS